jgi:peptide/nickel transport system permease protein
MVATPEPAPAPAEDATQPYSKDYWDLVLEQLGRNRLFQVAAAVLTLLYASAIYAPLIASDRPYVLEAANYAEYNKAWRTLYPATLGVGSVAKRTPEQYLAKRTEGSDLDYAQALENERSAVATQLEVMRTYLPAERHAGLAELAAAVEEVTRLASATAEARGEEDTARIAELAGAAKDRAKAVRTEYKALDPSAEGEPEGVELVGRRTYPMFEAISSWEAFFMVLWLFVMGWPLWNPLWNRLLCGGDRERVRRARRRKWAAVLGLSVVGALLWGQLIGGSSTLNVAPYKAALTRGEIVELEASFPPVPYGFAEIHSSEIFRPPTWASESEISEEGYYVRGPRVPQPDAVTGFVQPPNPVEVRFAEPERNAPARHWLGTDSVGRDFLTRMLWGGRVSLTVGLASAFLLVLIGTIIGAIAGYFGGAVDLFISRFIEIVLCLPALLLILMVSAFIDPEVLPPIFSIVILIALIRWTGVARLVRGEFLRYREAEFALAARALGFSSARTIFLHILPNAMAPVLVAGAFSVAAGILTESTLSFLGFGIQHPMPSWGSLINESKMAEHWWIQLFPGMLIFITITCYNQVGDALRDALDPKMKRH